MSIQFRTDSKTKKIVYIAVLVSIGVVLNLIEPNQILPMLPGAKLGLANLSSLLAVLLFEGFESVLVSFLRTIVASIFRGSLNWIAFGTSLFSGVASAFVMTLLYKSFRKKISIEGISAVGGVVNNIVQALFVYFVTKNLVFLYYIFFLIPIGGIAGFLIGVLGHNVYNRLVKL